MDRRNLLKKLTLGGAGLFAVALPNVEYSNTNAIKWICSYCNSENLSLKILTL